MTHSLNGPRWALFVLRIVVGLVFIAHGAQKAFLLGHAGVAGFLATLGMPAPSIAAALLIAAELGGGAALLLGLATRVAAISLAFTMLVAMVTVHLPHGFFAPQGVEYTLTLLAASTALALGGGGALALDNAIAGRRGADRAVRLAA